MNFSLGAGNSFAGRSEGTEREAPFWRRVLDPIRERF